MGRLDAMCRLLAHDILTTFGVSFPLLKIRGSEEDMEIEKDERKKTMGDPFQG